MPQPFRSTKTYSPGFSAAFRQWKADSHCKYLHGYALSFKFEFEAERLDERNWVVDFGDLGDLKRALAFQFDHTTIVAEDDPQKATFHVLHAAGVVNLRVMKTVGCEAFAQLAYAMAQDVCARKFPHVRVMSAECCEHQANSAIYAPMSFRDVALRIV